MEAQPRHITVVGYIRSATENCDFRYIAGNRESVLGFGGKAIAGGAGMKNPAHRFLEPECGLVLLDYATISRAKRQGNVLALRLNNKDFSTYADMRSYERTAPSPDFTATYSKAPLSFVMIIACLLKPTPAAKVAGVLCSVILAGDTGTLDTLDNVFLCEYINQDQRSDDQHTAGVSDSRRIHI